MRGSGQGSSEAGGRGEKGWERGVNQCLFLEDRDHCRFTPGVARAVREGFNRDAYTAYRESCSYLFTSSRD